jgi:hypothetical protein
MRWWDGAQWSGHWAPPIGAMRPHTDETMRWLLPVGRPGSAIAAGYLALFGFIIPFLGVGAVACGVVALATLKHRPDLIGRGRAILGIVGGCLSTLWWLFVFAGALTSSS